jgi:hypothetical protein
MKHEMIWCAECSEGYYRHKVLQEHRAVVPKPGVRAWDHFPWRPLSYDLDSNFL